MKIADYGHCCVFIPENLKEKAWLAAGEVLGLVHWDMCNYGYTQRITTTENWKSAAPSYRIEDVAASPASFRDAPRG